MKTTIDPAGRLVVPKPLRQRLGFKGGETVEIRERDGLLEIGPAPTPMVLVRKKGGGVAVPHEPLPPLTDEIVRETLERSRR